MNDRDLLELAAKAAGVNLVWHTLKIDGKECECSFNMFDDGRIACWEPHINDGDAFRLAVDLCIHLEFAETCVIPSTDKFAFSSVPLSDDAYAATRRAIVLAAAEIGKK